MANSISSGINQLLRSNVPEKTKTGIAGAKPRGPSAAKQPKGAEKSQNIFGESAKIELSPEVEMYGKVVDMLQKKYDNADVFVAGPGEDLSQIGGDLEYSIILSEDEMKLLASEDPKDKEAKDKLMGQIDDAMKTISDMSGKIDGVVGDPEQIENFGIKFDKSGKMNFFADIGGSGFTSSTMEDLIKNIGAGNNK